MCGTDGGKISKKTVGNTLELTKYLMKKYGVDEKHIVRHYDASRKDCPSAFHSNNWARWWDFKKRLNTTSSSVITTEGSGNSSKENYKNGKLDGEKRRYYENGKLEMIGNYRKNNMVGSWKWYDIEGNIVREREIN